MKKPLLTDLIGFLFLCLLALYTNAVFAQESIPGQPIVCYSKTINVPVHIIPTKNAFRLQQSSVTFQVTYEGFPEEAKAAFQKGIELWSAALNSPVPIHISASWVSLTGNTLASTKATKLFRGFEGALQPDIWYPVALAERIVGKDLNSTDEADIAISLNKEINWYVGTDGNTPPDHIDLISVILHEIAHGLGFTSSATIEGEIGMLRDEGNWLIYDVLLENSQHVRLSSFLDSSVDLSAQFTSGHLYLHSSQAALSNGGQFAKVFAPGFFVAGTSISHLDEQAFPKGNANSLMSPYFAMGESVHILGGVLLGVLADLGWDNSRDHPYEATIFPNPGSGIFNIRLPVNITQMDVRIIDATGKEVRNVKEIDLNEPVNQIDLSDLANGLYGIWITTSQGDWKQKLVIIK